MLLPSSLIIMSMLKESDSQEDSLNSSVSGPQPGPAVILDDLIGAAEIAVKKTEEHVFNKNKTIDELFPDTTGNIRLSVIFKVYCVPDHEARHKLDFVDANGNASMIRASCSQRAKVAVKEDYKT